MIVEQADSEAVSKQQRRKRIIVRPIDSFQARVSLSQSCQSFYRYLAALMVAKWLQSMYKFWIIYRYQKQSDYFSLWYL